MELLVSHQIYAYRAVLAHGEFGGWGVKAV